MSGSSSTTSTRNTPSMDVSRDVPRAAVARSFIRDFDLGQVLRVFHDARRQGRAVAAVRALLDLLAEGRDQGKAVRVAHALHAVPELAQLLEIGCGERRAQAVDLLVAVAQEHRDQVLEIARDDHFVDLLVHLFIIEAGYLASAARAGQGLSDSASRARGRCG